MIHQLSIVICIIVLAAVTIRGINNDRFKRSGINNPGKGIPISRFISMEGFLIGERTPVWTAKNPNDDNSVVYSRLRRDTMKRAMTKWKKNGGRSVELHPSIDAYWKIKSMNYGQSSIVDTDVLHLSIMVVMDYEGQWNKSDSTETNETRIDSMLHYAMAFWNSVDYRLRFFRPKIRIRIAGIIIGDVREDTPYIYDNFSPTGVYDAESAILTKLQYWNHVSETHKDFPKNSYDCVITLTELKSRERIKYDYAVLHRELQPESVGVLSLIINDDRMFSGVQEAADELVPIIHELPLTERQNESFHRLIIPQETPPFLQFRYFSADENQFYHGLSKPKGHLDPGKPLETILPGQVSPALQQCKFRNPNFTEVCWGKMTCQSLTCSGKGIVCSDIGPPADGTRCGERKMCVAEECYGENELQIH